MHVKPPRVCAAPAMQALHAEGASFWLPCRVGKHSYTPPYSGLAPCPTSAYVGYAIRFKAIVFLLHRALIVHQAQILERKPRMQLLCFMSRQLPSLFQNVVQTPMSPRGRRTSAEKPMWGALSNIFGQHCSRISMAMPVLSRPCPCSHPESFNQAAKTIVIF